MAYRQYSGQTERVMIRMGAGEEDQSFLEWPGSGKRFTATARGKKYSAKLPAVSSFDEPVRFSFSGDGKFFATCLAQGGKPGQVLIAATDGSVAWSFPSGWSRPAFSPASDRIAFVNDQDGLAVCDLKRGEAKTLAPGKKPDSPFWTDADTLVFCDKDDGRLYQVIAASDQYQALTPPGQSFTVSSFPAAYQQRKLALIKRGGSTNIFSFDISNGELYQVTNSAKMQRGAVYLPGSDSIFFQELWGLGAPESSELCLIADDGSDFKMFTQDYAFDGQASVSLSSGRLLFQNSEEADTSICMINPDGSARTTIVAGDATRWVGDPNFAAVADWQADNPLRFEPQGDFSGGRISLRATNAGGSTVSATLRAFPGSDLKLAPAEGLAPSVDNGAEAFAGAGDNVAFVRWLEWSLELGPGESKLLTLSAQARSGGSKAPAASLLLSLAVPGSPPRMIWRDLG